jgi:hypothetical protein
MIGPAPICMDCKHFNSDNRKGLTCKAFPYGIPEEIITNKVDHKKPYKNDNGIQFVEK